MTARRDRGFTLIEIMVALLIMAGLSLIMAQSVKSGLESRKKVQRQITEESLIRDAMRLMVSDVAAAFHHRDYTVSNYNKVLELRKKKTATAGQPSGGAGQGQQPGQPGVPAGQVSGGAPPPPPAPDPLASATPLPEPNQLTAFVGSNEAMTFSVKNHVRRFIDAKESDQARIAYFLRSCPNEGKGGGVSSCLVRQETINPTDQFPLSPSDEDDAKGVILVHHVTEFKLRYLEAGKTDFVESWDSSPSATSDTKDKFPDAVEITMAIQDKTNSESKLRSLSWLAPVRNSNNLSAADKEAAAKAAEAAAATRAGSGPGAGLGSGLNSGPAGTGGATGQQP